MCSPNVARPFATIRKRPHEGPMAVPMAIVAKVVSFRSVKRRIALFRVAGVALCIVQMRFMCERCSAFASLSEDELQFSWQTQHFRDLHRHFLWHVHHFKRVALRFFFFCESHCQGCGIAVSKREIAKETLKERCLQLGFFWGQSSETRVRSKTRLNRLLCGTTLQSGDSRTVQTNNMKLLAAHPPGTK